jgi:di/tricarboxylate transporter
MDLARLLVPSAAASAFLNNTPIVAMLLPSVVANAEARKLAPSRYLMPLSFAVVLGGAATTIGTSTNLVVSGMLEASGRAPLGLFEITPLGLPIAVAGIAFLAFAAPRLLPDRASPRSRFAESEREFVVRMIVAPGGPLVGRTVSDANLRHLDNVFLAQIEREGEPLGPTGPDAVLHAGDHLLFVGEARNVADLRRHTGLRSAEDDHLLGLDGESHRLVEVVVGTQSPLIGRTPREANFREHYQAAIVGIQREGQPVSAKLGTIRLRLGDTLLLLADPGFSGRWGDRPDFLLVSASNGPPTTDRLRVTLVAGITLAIVVAAGSGALPILHASLLGALAVLACGCLSIHDARSAIEIDVLVVIAASFGVGAAIESSGLAAVIGAGIVDVASDTGWRTSLVAVVLATVVLTEFISNNAAAALMFPIAVATATEIGEDPRRFAIAVAIAASCSFLTPVGYQTNTMVYGPGGYRFGDYWRLGAPLTLLVVAWLAAAA